MNTMAGSQEGGNRVSGEQKTYRKKEICIKRFMIGLFVTLLSLTFVIHNFERFTQCDQACVLANNLFVGPMFLSILLTFGYLMYLMKYKHNYEYKKSFKA